MGTILDCLVIGGGPAGQTAAIYLGRFRRSVLIVDKGWSRAEWITRSHNLPGYPEGVAGPAFLECLRQQAGLYGATRQHGVIDTLRKSETGFIAEMGGTPIAASTVLLATGVVENPPPLPHLAEAVKQGLIRTCPICDGYENIDKRIAVLGDGEHAAAEALFLRTFTSKLTLLLELGDPKPLSAKTLTALGDAGIEVDHVAIGAVHLEDGGVTALTAEDGRMHRFDAVYSAFGTTAQTQLAKALNARMDRDDRLLVNEHQETSVKGLFAAGDVVRGLNQISVANGEAAIAATAIHNRLPHGFGA